MVVDHPWERRSRAESEAQRDREMLLWIARFRFVTSEVLAARFGVSPQRVNARLRRLEHAGLVVLHRSAPTLPRAVFVSGRGARRLGLRVRRAPRPDAHREHELAVATLAAGLERAADPPVVLTERDARALEADGGPRCSADVREKHAGTGRRWPDLVLEYPGGERVAVEIEFAAKHTERLRRIVAGYAQARWFSGVCFLVREPKLERRIAALAHDGQPSSELAAMLELARPETSVRPWRGPDAAVAALGQAAPPGTRAS